MSSRMIFGAAMAVMSLVFATGCTHEAKKKPRNDSLRVLQDLGKNSYTILEFPKGEANLSSMNKVELKNFVEKVNKEKLFIDEIKILAWSDVEYPKEKKKIHPREVILANDRVREIKNFLEKKIEERKDIQTFNMAKRPGTLEEMLKTEDYALKTALEQTYPTSTPHSSGEISYSKASKAIVIIDYQHN